MSETTEDIKVKEYEVSESDIKEMGEEIDKGNIKDKVFSWLGRNLLDKTVTKDMKFSILKTFINKLPMPKVEPPRFEDLMYQESILLYKMRVVLNYMYQVEDNFAASIFSHEADHLKRYREITNNFFNFLIMLCESDSFYRHRVGYLITMMKSDMLLNHYFRLICMDYFECGYKCGFVCNSEEEVKKHIEEKHSGQETLKEPYIKYNMKEEWNGRVIDIKLSPDSFFRNEAMKGQSRELQGVFSHLATAIADNTTLQKKL